MRGTSLAARADLLAGLVVVGLPVLAQAIDAIEAAAGADAAVAEAVRGG